jgi:hypothetical protein
VDKMPKVKDEEVEVAVDAEVEVSGWIGWSKHAFFKMWGK